MVKKTEEERGLRIDDRKCEADHLLVRHPLGRAGDGSLHRSLRGNLGSRSSRDGRVASAVAARAGRLSSGRLGLTLVEGASAVDTGPLSFGTVALLKDASSIVGRLVPVASHDVVDVRAPLLCIGTNASSEAELGGRHEVLPFVNLLELSGKGTGEDHTTDGITGTGGTVRVQLATFVSGLDVELGQVTLSGDLDKGGRLEEVSTLDGTVGNQSGTVSRLHAPSNLALFRSTNLLVGSVGRKETEVLDAVQEDILASRLLAGGTVSGDTVVVAVLTVGSVGLVGHVGRVIVGLDGGDGQEGKEGDLLEHFC